MYDITTPIKIGMFTLATAALIFYFLWLVDFIAKHPKRKAQVTLAVVHILIMVIGLFLTGFAGKL